MKPILTMIHKSQSTSSSTFLIKLSSDFSFLRKFCKRYNVLYWKFYNFAPGVGKDHHSHLKNGDLNIPFGKQILVHAVSLTKQLCNHFSNHFCYIIYYHAVTLQKNSFRYLSYCPKDKESLYLAYIETLCISVEKIF